MSELFSVCCVVAPLDAESALCSECREHASFEELCSLCDEPCLLDGEAQFGASVVYDSKGGVQHYACAQPFLGGK